MNGEFDGGILETHAAYGVLYAALGVLLAVSATLDGAPVTTAEWVIVGGGVVSFVAGALTVASPERFGPDEVSSWQTLALLGGDVLLLFAVGSRLG